MNQVQHKTLKQKFFTPKQKNKKPKTFFLTFGQKIKIVLTVSLCFANVFASANNSQKNYFISSKTAVINQQEQTALYKGDVTVSENKFTIKGESLVIYYEMGRIKELFVTGLPSLYEEKPNRKASKVSIKAYKMEYRTDINEIHFKGSVELQRNRDTVTADLLKYNLETQELWATSNDKSEPIRITINALSK